MRHRIRSLRQLTAATLWQFWYELPECTVWLQLVADDDCADSSRLDMRTTQEMIRGPFRIDCIVRTGHGIVVEAKVNLGNHGGYVLLHSDASGAGITCSNPEQVVLTSHQFRALPSDTIPEIAAKFSRAMIEAGNGPMCDMDNNVCARTSEDVDRVQFLPRGHVGPYK